MDVPLKASQRQFLDGATVRGHSRGESEEVPE